ncbi:MAG: hypothetical protein KBT47_07985 [Armatimonadetes bacterium]|nr:hypothetical protein [Candidatus Hippobium faecium]
MTSKERVKKAFNREKTDRVPMNYLCNRDIDRRLKEHFGLDIEDNEGLYKCLNVDFRQVFNQYTGKRLHEEIEGCFVDPALGVTSRWVENEFGGYMDFCYFPLRNMDMDTALNWKLPDPEDYDYQNFADYVKSHSDYYITYNNQPDIINANGRLMGMEDLLAGLILEDKAVLTFVERHFETLYEVLKRTLEKCGDFIDYVWMGEDLGTQRGPMVSLELFRKHILPFHRKFAELIKKYDISIMFHSCGSASWAYDDLIDIGVDVVDALQPEAKDMEPEYLLKRFGDRLGFHGMISTAGPLAYGTPEDTEKNVLSVLDIMAGQGYAMAPTHQIQDNSPTENVLRMYKTGYEYNIKD